MTTEKDIEIQEMRQLLDEARTSLIGAKSELSDAQFALKWTREKLIDLEEKHRKATMLLVKLVELPDPKEVEELLRSLDRPCGFVPCAKCSAAASVIRKYAKAENWEREGATDGTDS